MGLYNFQMMFRPYIESGEKRHTIRAERAHPDKPGDTMHLYTGLRTKHSLFIFRAPCVRVESFSMHRAQVWVNGEELSIPEKDLLAYRDGFRYDDDPSTTKGCFDLMLEFWVKRHGDIINFRGNLNHWDFERRELQR